MKLDYLTGSWLLVAACILSTKSEEENRTDEQSIEEKQLHAVHFSPLIMGSSALLGAFALYLMNQRGYFDDAKNHIGEARGFLSNELTNQWNVASEAVVEMLHTWQKDSKIDEILRSDIQTLQSLPVYQRLSRTFNEIRGKDSRSLWTIFENKIAEFIQLYMRKMEYKKWKTKSIDPEFALRSKFYATQKERKK